MTRRTFNAVEAARYIAVHPSTIHRWIRAGTMRARVEGGRYRVTAAEIERMVRRDTLPTFGSWRTEGEPPRNVARMIRRSRDQRARELRRVLGRVLSRTK